MKAKASKNAVKDLERVRLTIPGTMRTAVRSRAECRVHQSASPSSVRHRDKARGSRFSILLSESSARSRDRTVVSPSETARSGREHRIPLMAPARHPVLPCLSVHVRTAEAPILSAAVRHRGSPARTVHARRPEITREAKDNTTAVSGRTVPETEHSAHPGADPEWAEASCC